MKKLIIKTSKIVGWILFGLFLLLLLLIVAIQIPAVQNKVKDIAISFVQDKIGTPVSLDRIEIAFPKKIVIKELYVESQQRDTLLYSKYLGVDIDPFALASGNVNVKHVELDGLKAGVKRDSLGGFNFDYILSAFSTGTEEEDTDDSGGMAVDLGKITLSNLDLNYADAFDGHHVAFKLKHFVTRFKHFDLNEMIFSIPKIGIEGIDVNYKKELPSTAALAVKDGEEEVGETAASVLPTLELGTITWTDSKILFEDRESALYANVALGAFSTTFEQIDLVNQQIDFSEIKLLDTKATVKISPTAAKIVAAVSTPQPVEETPASPWSIGVEQFTMQSIAVKYDDDNVKPLAFGLDPNHIAFNDINFKLKDFQFSPQLIKGNLEGFSFREKSGLALEQFKTYFAYGEQTSFIKELVLETPNTKLDVNAILHYTDVNTLVDNLGDVSVDLGVKQSYLGLKDVYLAMPSVFEEAGMEKLTTKRLSIDVMVKGLVNNLHIQKLVLTGLQSTAVNLTGTVKGATTPDKAVVDLQLHKLQTSAKDILSITPKGVLPADIEIPSHLSLSGYAQGGMQAIRSQLDIKTTSGNAGIEAFFDQRVKGEEKYELAARIDELRLGQLLMNDSIGTLSMTTSVSGIGLDPKTMQAKGNVHISQAEYNGYNYNNLRVDAEVENGKYEITSINEDPNLRFDLAMNGVWKEDGVSLDLLADFKHIDLHKLQLEDAPAVFKGSIEGKMANVMPDDLDGQLAFRGLSYLSASRSYNLEPIEIIATSRDRKRTLDLTSEIIDFSMEGEYKVTQLADALIGTFNTYYEKEEKSKKEEESKKIIAEEDSVDEGERNYFLYTVLVKNNAVIHSVVPELKELEPITLSGKYDSEIDHLSLKGLIPLVIYGENEIRNIALSLTPSNDALDYELTVERMANESIALSNLALGGVIRDNTISYHLTLKDKDKVASYLIAGDVRAEDNGMIARLYPEGFMLDYQQWQVNPENRIVLNPEGFYIKDFKLSNGDNALEIESKEAVVNSPMRIAFKDFSIEMLTKMIKNEVLLASGFINGEVFLKDLTTDYRFVSNIDIDKLHVMEIGLGNLHVGVKNESASRFITDISLQGGENRISIGGWADADTQQMNMQLDLTKFQMAALEYLSKGELSGTEGFLSGGLTIGGKFTEPEIIGAMNFNDVGFSVKQLNGDFRKINEKISFTKRGVEFEKFSITDADGNLLVVDGQILTKAYQDFAFNLSIKAVDFKAVNSTVKDNEMYYGKLVFDSNINIKGDLNKPVVTGGISINKKTDFSFVLPQEDPSIADREGIVEFVDQHSLQLAELQKYEEDFNTSALRGLDVSLSIKVDKEAAFTMVMDKSSGDKVVLKGDAELVGGIDPSGKVTLSGRYEFSEGSYDLSFNMIKRRFEIEKGSYIIWAGDPTDANLHLTAIYETRTAPMDLLGNQLSSLSPTQQNMYKQKIPFQALLKMEGELLKPEISFDVQLKEGITSVSGDVLSNTKTKLEQLRQNESELNKQVFALLLLNRFIGENPFESSAGGMSAGAMARQSVSRLLSDQLNNLAGDLIAGVELNFNLDSTEDYSTGSRENRTDLNVAVSKRLFADRLKVTVGSSFEVEGNTRQNEQAANIAGDIELEYALSQDGRYLLRVYRKNTYEVALQGQIVETGVGFVITMSYERFRELFERSKDKRQLKRQLSNEAKQEKDI